jgi:muconolactone delta-isomerase
MQFMCVMRRRVEMFSQEEFQKLLDPEAEYVRKLYSQGIVRQIWSREDVLGAVILAEAGSREELDAALAQLPLNAAGMLEATIIQMKGYRGFGPKV